MTNRDALRVSSAMLVKAKELGADLVGFAGIKDLKSAPSFTFAPQMPGAGDGTGMRRNELGLKPGEVAWPENARTVMVLAIHHPEGKPEMDWWFGRKDPPGNRILARVVRQLCEWITEKFGIGVFHLPYHVEKGGTFLKDASVMASLGCIGKNNLLITPEFGPRVRLRAMTLDIELPSTGPESFDPCHLCDDLCRKSCPQNAFAIKIYEETNYNQEYLPGRDGYFARPFCNVQMVEDQELAQEQIVDGFTNPVKMIKYCRRCEFSCPVGQPLS